ncbi:MAG TPA: YwiC-like family protein [Candidatus Sulfotelmatobacter sp.]|nr:YwiC-like family protein [Candidatus Sulfotelmatobacter sp.]
MTAKTHAEPALTWRPETKVERQSSPAVQFPGGDREEAQVAALRERNRALIVPREHGAWGLLLVPMVTAAGVAFRESHNVFPFVLLLTAALALFWLRTPLESLLGTSAMRAQGKEERSSVTFVIAYLAMVAGLALSMLLWAGHNPLLWAIGGAAGLAFAGQALLRTWGRSTRMLSEIVGTIGLTSSAAAVYYVITGKFGVTAWMLWLVNMLFAGNQIHYVQIRIHTAKVAGMRAKLARAWTFAAGQLAMAAALCAACLLGWMPWITLIAFVPLLLRGSYYFVQKPAPLRVRRLGWTELTQAIVFCVLFIATSALSV